MERKSARFPVVPAKQRQRVELRDFGLVLFQRFPTADGVAGLLNKCVGFIYRERLR